ncbi:MAG: glycosyltransferase family 4 protein [Acidobacteriota bacterium]
MRILFISHSSPMKEGGAETRTREVAFRLVRSGHAVTILCGKTSAGDPRVTEVSGVRIVSKKTLPDWLLRRYPYPHYFSLAAANFFLMFYVPSFLREGKFDLIREDLAPFPPTFLLSLVHLPVARRIAVAHMLSRTLKGWTKYYGPVFGLAGFAMDRLLRSGALKYDRIICAAKWFADEMKESPAIADKVCYVPNGVNLNEFSPAQPAADNNGHIRLLSVGRLAETKGHRYAIEAMSYLKRDYPDLRLDILGNGPLKERLREVSQQFGVADMIEFCPPVGHAEMPNLYRRYDFLVMPSIWEGLPVSLIEAMASKLPIVASDIPAITDVLGIDSATLASKEDARDLADKLRWAFQHRDQVSKHAESAFEIARKYDWAVTASKEVEEAC